MAEERLTEITAVSNKSFEHAIDLGLSRANEILEHIESAWVTDMRVIEKDGQADEYRVSMKLMLVTNIKPNTS